MPQDQLCFFNMNRRRNINRNNEICNSELATEFISTLSNITLYQDCILSYYQHKKDISDKIFEKNAIGSYKI